MRSRRTSSLCAWMPPTSASSTPTSAPGGIDWDQFERDLKTEPQRIRDFYQREGQPCGTGGSGVSVAGDRVTGMAKKLSPQVRDHLEWLGFIQPTGLVVSAHALVQAGAILNRRDIEGQELLKECVEERDCPAQTASLSRYLPDFRGCSPGAYWAGASRPRGMLEPTPHRFPRNWNWRFRNTARPSVPTLP